MQSQATAANASIQGIPDQHWTDDQMSVLAAASDHGTILMTASQSPGEPVSSDWASRFGSTDLELITSDTSRNWFLYRAAGATGG